MTEEIYKNKPIELYQAAKENATRPEDFPGSDIWRFFKDDIKDYAISNCHRNILIILTDGYMYYDKTVINENGRTSYITPVSLKNSKLKISDWKEKMEEKNLGFLKATNQLDDIEILVLGVRSENSENPYALDILRTYWEEWLMEMGVGAESIKIKEADIASSVDKVIRDFILK